MYSMMEAEIIAVLEGFKAIARLEDRTGRRVANKLAIYVMVHLHNWLLCIITGFYT